MPTEHSQPIVSPEFTARHFALLLGIGIIAAFPNVFLGLSTFVIRDFGFFAYPLASYQKECFWRGEIPLWNPYNQCGIPFLAQWNTMPLYPPSLIYLVLPLPWSLNLFCLLHLFWAGLGMYQLGRRWSGSGLAGAVAGMAFGYNGFALNLLMWPSHIATYSWMPWVVLLVERAWNQGGRWVFLAALAGAVQMLAGGPETILFTWAILAVLWVARLIAGQRFEFALESAPCPASGSGGEPSDEQSSSAKRYHVAWRFPFIVALVACIAAAQILPFLDLAAHSQREQGFADARWSMPSWGWANFLVPRVFGTVGKQNLFFQYGQYWTSSYYLGLGILVLAIVAVASVRRARLWLMLGVAVTGLVLAMGDQTGLSRWARHLLPQLSLMTYPVKYVTLVIFAVPLLGAYGLVALQRKSEKAKSQRLVWTAAGFVGALIVGVLFWAWKAPFSSDDIGATFWNGVSRICVLALTGCALWFLLKTTKAPSQPMVRALVPWLVLVLFWVDIRTHEPQQNPSVATWVYLPNLARTRLSMTPQPELGISRTMMSPAAEANFRERVMDDPKDNFLVKRLGYFANCNLLDGVPTANGFFSLAPRECGELYSLLYVNNYPFGAPLQDFLGVSQLTASEDYTTWDAREKFMPLITAGQAALFLSDTNALGVLLSTNFNPARFVLLPPEEQGLVRATNQVNAQVFNQSVGAERVEFQVNADGPTLAVLSQTYYHRWQARVDGRPERVLRANFGFQAVPVPAGKHTVVLEYVDPAFQVGTRLSGLGLVLCLGGLLACVAVEKLRRWGSSAA